MTTSVLFSLLVLSAAGCTRRPASDPTEAPSPASQPAAPVPSIVELETLPSEPGPEPVAARDRATYSERQIRGRQRRVFSVDFSTIDRPTTIESFQSAPHLSPLTQDRTGTCWSFGGTSFVESELFRMRGYSPRLSVMYGVYSEYIEKTKHYVQTKGESGFPEGSQADAVILRMKTYGTMPQSAYTGLVNGETKHAHWPMRKEMRAYLSKVKEGKRWNEAVVVAKIKKIMNKYLGAPPEKFEVEGKEYTPQEYMRDKLQFPVEEYVSFVSFKYFPFYTRGVHKVEDNWWKGDHYHNLPLDEWYELFRGAAKSGYTLGICGDTSEPGDGTEEDIAIIPSFDIAQEHINQDAREY
ncbi:MAG: peptidase C1 [Myxococcales bacterium FL481]|nr:MAG: peptidase C1 [Myxococcales bacterium FL481]